MQQATSNICLMIFVSLLAISLSACAVLQPRDKASQSVTIDHWVSGETTPHEEVLMLLNRFKILDSLPPKQLRAAHRSAERMFGEQPTMVTRLQLAWLLAMRNTGFQDIPRALRLLDIKKKSSSKEQPPKAIDDLAHFIRRTVMEQKVQQDQYSQAVAALKTERKTSEELATKIKDLTQIEESITQRKPRPETELR